MVGIGEGDGDGVGLGGVCADAPRVDAPATTMAATARERNHCFIERSYADRPRSPYCVSTGMLDGAWCSKYDLEYFAWIGTNWRGFPA